MEHTQDVTVRFNFETGELVLTFNDGSTYEYVRDEGHKLAQRFDRYVDKAIKEYVKELKNKRRLTTMN
jgi:hypothetical protein